MMIGERLRELREQRKFSQGEIEKRTGLLRCYTSRVENGYTVPAVETLEKFARALEVPMYQLFYEGNERPKPVKYSKPKADEIEWGSTGEEARLLEKFRKLLSHMREGDRNLFMNAAQKMARKTAKRKPSLK